MIWIETSAPAEEPVGVAELRAFLRLDREDEDALLGRLLRAAREDVERRTGLLVAERTGRLVVEAAVGTLALGFRPVTTILGVTLFDEDGATRLGDLADLRFENSPLHTRLHWRRPVVAAGGAELELRAGLPPELVPESLRLAMLRLAATAYETRTLLAPALQPDTIPPLVGSLLSPYRSLAI
ncbi:phage head-tail connector protein [Aureimonas sp. AU4]|uniref:head-tail connector protein n=1 Tax=Aureimonas sp. AU4 TaxID=1638163 RepID=UPI0007857E13|nr:phage head-tail connector protein [Aureimonas sp. AU4]